MSARRRRLHAAWRDRSGASAVEFAVAAPVLALVLAGFAQLAWTQHCTSALRYALTTSSRNLMLNPSMSEADLQALVKSKLTDADANVIVHLNVAAAAGGGKIATTTGSYDRTITLPLMPSIPIHYQTTVTTSLPAV